MSDRILSKRVAQGFYPERQAPRESKFDRLMVNLLGNRMKRLKDRPARYMSIVGRVNTHGEALGVLDEAGLSRHIMEVGKFARTDGLNRDLAAHIFALVREVAGRKIGMRHFDVQLVGGWIMLNGMVAEMETGEGKTLAATLPACAAALAGIPVHIITVNDYLAGRDAQWMKPVYEFFGLSVGIIRHGMTPGERREAYRCDITYCTNKEVVFDYLKDRIALGQRPGRIQMHVERLYSREARMDRLLLRGLSFAIVDEADSVLIDEARTPLIISGSGDESYESRVYSEALALAGDLKEDRDYELDQVRRTLDLTETGRDRLMELSEDMGGMRLGRQRREELVKQALTALYLFERDRDYIVRDGRVQIVDEYTGRVMADRSWERGLHQLMEAKEECEVSSQSVTMARISYQRFFRRYHVLAGMTGTAREVSGELWSVYRLPVVTVPTNKPVIRRDLPFRTHVKAEDKWCEIIDRIAQVSGAGRPVLVGTRFVGTSEELSRRLNKARIPHVVLNARQDEQEAEIIAGAGERSRITVATNMAGRGTDISLGQGVGELGGLHVLATELHDAKRIDRQLFGRCGRQGDPGSFEAILSLEDNLFAGHLKGPLGRMALRFTNPCSVFGRWVGRTFTEIVQRKIQNEHFHVRRALLQLDESIEKSMAFSGRGE